MTTLYVSQGACSFAAHVTVKELNLDVDVVNVPLRTAESPIYSISPFGKVPAVVSDNDTLITENSAVLPFLADLDRNQRLIAKFGTDERAQIQAWLGFLSAEVHAGSFRIVNRAAEIHSDSEIQKTIRQYGLTKLKANLNVVEQHLADKPFLVAERLTVADLYLGVFLTWYARIDAEFNDFPRLQKAHQYFLNLPSVQAAKAAETAKVGTPA